MSKEKYSMRITSASVTQVLLYDDCSIVLPVRTFGFFFVLKGLSFRCDSYNNNTQARLAMMCTPQLPFLRVP